VQICDKQYLHSNRVGENQEILLPCHLFPAAALPASGSKGFSQSAKKANTPISFE
jgi:hypothetical protein